MKSPFKFLDSFGPEDKNAFFGRDEETASLYDMVYKNRLILVYGQSGTGKTSLIQCGLAKHFDSADWLPLTIRRGVDINQSLRETLLQKSGERPSASLTQSLETLYLNALRPIYLIFDQLEEIFILGSAAEQLTFIETVRDVLATHLPCRILFVIREEYLGHLYDFEKVIPTLFDRRLRVEPMSAAKTKTVLEGSFKRFNISVKPPQDAVYQTIIENISGGKAGIQLPYLQVYLDLLYKEDFAKTHPEKTEIKQSDGSWLPIEFSGEEISALGKIENVLEKFLREQTAVLQSKLKAEFPSADSEAVQKTLDAFVSPEGTKRPVGFSWNGKKLLVEPKIAPLFQPSSPEILGFICPMLEQARLLRFSDDSMELAHDALAQVIDNQRSTEQRQVQKYHSRILAAHREFTESGEFAPEKLLNSLTEYLPLFNAQLEPEVKNFIALSRENVRKIQQAELEAERQKRLRERRFTQLAVASAVIFAALAAVAFFNFRAAEAAKIEIAEKALEAQLQIAKTQKLEGKYDDAIAQLAECQRLAREIGLPEKSGEIEKTASAWQRVRNFAKAAEQFRAAGDLRPALQNLDSALALDADARLSNLRLETSNELEERFKTLLQKGAEFLLAGQKELARKSFEKALLLRPGDLEVLKWLGKI